MSRVHTALTWATVVALVPIVGTVLLAGVLCLPFLIAADRLCYAVHRIAKCKLQNANCKMKPRNPRRSVRNLQFAFCNGQFAFPQTRKDAPMPSSSPLPPPHDLLVHIRKFGLTPQAPTAIMEIAGRHIVVSASPPTAVPVTLEVQVMTRDELDWAYQRSRN